jgi:ABC-type polar amino acid transport system ATPase subunit
LASTERPITRPRLPTIASNNRADVCHDRQTSGLAFSNIWSDCDAAPVPALCEAWFGIRAMSEDQEQPMPLLRISKLHKEFSGTAVLSGIDLDVARGEKVSIIGPSGSGKTTLLRCINYLEKPTSGQIYIDGTLIGTQKVGESYVNLSDRELAKERREIGFVFQRFNLFPHLTALDNVTIAPRKVLGLSREAAEERGRDMLRKVGLGHKIEDYPERLSGGQQQRVAIARVLCMQPKLMLFDEATSALDPELVGEVLRVMRDLAAEGRTMIIVTHEIQFAGEVSDRVIFMDHGKIVEQGRPQDILTNALHARTRSFLNQIRER